MKQDVIKAAELGYAPCRYGTSRMMFRGPERSLDALYLAFVGSTETFGKFIESPFPDRVETAIGKPCVNLGCVNGGIDAFVYDPCIIDICKRSQATVLQIMGANYLTNRYFSVHPRRNDRFVGASDALRQLYEDVDFSQFTFTRHMLGALQEACPKRFDLVVDEVQTAWLGRMHLMLSQLGARIILLWFSNEPLSDQHWAERPSGLQADPLFITKTMIEELRPAVHDVVVVNPSAGARALGSQGMWFVESQRELANGMLGIACHAEASAALVAVLKKHL